jgi:lysophospholipase L1-like esterase
MPRLRDDMVIGSPHERGTPARRCFQARVLSVFGVLDEGIVAMLTKRRRLALAISFLTGLILGDFSSGMISAAVDSLRAVIPIDRFWWVDATPSPYAKLRQELFNAYPGRADVVVVGDSLSEWMDWGSALPGTSIVNRAIAGETVLGAVNRIQSIAATGAHTAILMIGINDLNMRVPVDRIFRDYKKLVEALRSAGMRVIVFPCLTGSGQVVNAARTLNDRVRELCTSGLCEYRELNELLGPDGRLRPEYTFDNTHLTALAYGPWVASISAALSATQK